MTVKMLWQQQSVPLRKKNFDYDQKRGKIFEIFQSTHYTFFIINASLAIDSYNMQISTPNFFYRLVKTFFLKLFTNIVSLTSRVPQTLVIRFWILFSSL